MTPAAIVLCVAVAAWGPVAPSPEPSPEPASSSSSTLGAEPAPPVAPAATGIQPLAPPPPASPARAPAPTIQAPMIAKAPLNVGPAPTLVAAPRRQPAPRAPLYKQWGFWAVAGGVFAAAVLTTIVVTRSKPDPYTGNAPPYIVGLP